MIARYRLLARRIQLELEELERTQAAIQKHWQTAHRVAADQDAYLNSVALNLHSFYSALERVFELIALELDGGALGGDSWHIELLRQMSIDVPGMRPPVLQPDTAARLDEYRKFRHRIRNIYTTNLDPDRMASLVTGLPAFWQAVRQELAAFAATAMIGLMFWGRLGAITIVLVLLKRGQRESLVKCPEEVVLVG